MKELNSLRARLDASAAGKGSRPRGNSVTAAEYAAALPFAQACGAVIRDSLYPAYYRSLNEDGDAGERLAAPPEALPPTA